ncbi:MAG: tetratricopeptide repeat protein [Chryseolinea sp.]
MRTIIILVTSIVLTIASSINCSAQSAESNPAAYQAYLSRSATDAQQAWATLVSSAENELKTSANDDAKFKLALAQYGLLNSTMRSKDETTFKKYVNGAITNLESIKAKHEGEAMAMLAAVYGLQMAYDQSKGMALGPRSSSLLSKAKKTDPSSPLVWRLYANSMLHTPEAYGGDVVEAISSYEKSISLYEASPEKTKNNWMYIDTMAFLGQAYVRNNESSKAVTTYEKALAIEPSFGWIKYNLLPAAQSKAK